MSNRAGRLRAALVGRNTLVVFAALAIGAFLPAFVPELAPVLYPLVLPSYLVTAVVYDGGLLEAVIYALEPVVPLDGRLLWGLGQAVVLYLFTVVAALLGSVLSRRFGPERGGTGDQDARNDVRLRYLVAGGLLVIGVGLVAQGVVSQPTMTSVTCEGSASAGGNATATATPECTRTTEPATGQRYYILGLGTGIGLLGGAVVAVDRWLADRQ